MNECTSNPATLRRCRNQQDRTSLADASALQWFPPEMRKFVVLAAASASSVLLTGETGSGKTHLAKLIHDLGARRNRPFLAINCAAIADTLFESELFGSARGAFTGATHDRAGLIEEASGGTLLLDEIGELPLALQAKLLDVFERDVVRRVGEARLRPVNVRVIVATNRDPEVLIREKRFRADLYYRCAVLPFCIAPLRSRMHELSTLVYRFLQEEAGENAEPFSISPEALESLRGYVWPGNMRELHNALRYACARAQTAMVNAEHLPERVRSVGNQWNAEGAERGRGRRRYAAPPAAEEERKWIVEALAAEGGNETRAAKRLGMARSTLWQKMGKYDVRSSPAIREPSAVIMRSNSVQTLSNSTAESSTAIASSP